ncbi:TonB-dependent receptor plug domain-containing protein [Acetobacteraceae bacterium KSS8]|uniref:TonB-dependent receptor plug domain-containing protein n=1 Tax=Endosaccharibacter trunci TaxID=2812733 RepID=A0ABT1W8G1_9PROT|nr:TonB-dependent receptor plug domain-containing protein [Acetobacteraceae bacterium KSS8]
MVVRLYSFKPNHLALWTSVAMAAWTPLAFAQAPAVTPAHAASKHPRKAKPTSATSRKPKVEVITVAARGLHDRTGPNDAAKPMDLGTSPLNDIAEVSHLDNTQIRNTATHTSADLLRSIPGFAIDDFQNGGIAQGIGARGWPTESDGNYVATYVDGYIRNLYSGPSTNGYDDLNPLIPELIGGLTVVHGPFDVRYGGNFSSAGDVVFTTRDFTPTGFSLSGGSFGHVRGLATIGLQRGNLDFYTALEGMHEDGYRQNNKNERLNSFSKAVVHLDNGDTIRVTAQGYWTDYGQAGSIRQSLLESGAVPLTIAVNDHDRGAKNQYTLTGQYVHTQGNMTLDANVYADKALLIRQITRGDPGVFKPQNDYRDDRYTLGGGVEPYWLFKLQNGGSADLRTGVTTHVDFARVYRQPGVDGVPVEQPSVYSAITGVFSLSRFTEINPAAYISSSIKPWEWVKATGGVRYDEFTYDLYSTTYVKQSNSLRRQHIVTHTGTPTIKFGLALNPIKPVTVFANYGQSITSPNANTDLPSNPHLQSSRLGSEEIGVRYDYRPLDAHIQVSSYYTVNSNEIGTDQATLTQTNLGKSHRSGYDVDGSIALFRGQRVQLNVHGSYNYVRARLVSAATSFIPNVADWLADYGFDAYMPLPNGNGKNLDLTVDHQFVGPQPLDSSRIFVAKQYQRIATKLTYNDPRQHNMRVWVSAIIFPENRLSEDAFVSSGAVYTAPQPFLTMEGGVSFGF